MTTPPTPPAVAEFLVLEAAARRQSPLRRVLDVADRVVALAEAAGIPVHNVGASSYPSGNGRVTLYAEDDKRTHELAALLHLSPTGDSHRRDLTFYEGPFQGVTIATHGPTLARVVDSDTGEHMTDLLPVAAAEAIVASQSRRGEQLHRVRVEAVA